VGTHPTRPSETLRFRRQHEELQALAKELLQCLDTRTLAENPAPARRVFAAFIGKLRVHAAMEEEALYPRLLQSRDPDIAGKARELHAELGDLYAAAFALARSWENLEAIRRAPEDLCRDTISMLHRLGRRMKRENAELYPLVDAAVEDASG
jgi:hemerythrin-like domain-containing protein